MKYLVLGFVFAGGFLTAHITGVTSAAQQPPAMPPAAIREAQVANSSIDMNGYIRVAQEAERHRATRRLTEEEFIRMSAEPGTVVLDARSKEMYDLMHVKGAINLSFPDIDVESLAKTLPDKNVRILIYCNNNFTAAPPRPGVRVPVPPQQAPPLPAIGGGPPRRVSVEDVAKQAFRPKEAVASLNITTYTALYAYGYRNVYELGPLVNPVTTRIPFELSKQ